MSPSLPKILETGINVFISNSQIITIKTYYEKSTIYKCGERYFSRTLPLKNNFKYRILKNTIEL